MTWMTGTYDPDLNLVYWGTGNPTPVLNGKTRPGDNLYTCSIVALNPDTGKLAWAFQPSPHDTHDWDAVETPVLVDADFSGKPRKMLMQTRATATSSSSTAPTARICSPCPYGPVNWAIGIDKKGRPIPNPAKEPRPDGRLIAPDEGGLTNYRSPSFDPKDRTVHCLCAPQLEHLLCQACRWDVYGWAGADYGVWGKGVHRGHRLPDRQNSLEPRARTRRLGAGVLTTDSGLTFTGDGHGNVLALDTSNGKTLWHAGTRRPHGDLSDHL